MFRFLFLMMGLIITCAGVAFIVLGTNMVYTAITNNFRP